MEEYIKAIVKSTGEPVYVKPCAPQRVFTRSYLSKDGQIVSAYALEFEKEIDWEKRRYEIAKDIFCSLILAPQDAHSLTIEGDAQSAVEFADILIEELKNNNN